jgi:Na+/proline symporter
MTATNFSSDTPLHQSGNARREGLTSWWFYLRFIIGRLSTSFFYAKLWRRADVLTESEFLELRHGRISAKVIRIITAVYNCFIFSVLVIGLSTLAMSKILEVVFQIPPTFSLGQIQLDSGFVLCVGLILFALVYSATSGLWGVVVTDLIQFIVAMVGSYALLYYVFKEVGGPCSLVEHIQKMANNGNLAYDYTKFGIGNFLKSPVIIMFFLPIHWFSDGEMTSVQRMMACRSEKDAMLSQLMRVAINNVLRGWPWVLCGLASIVIFSTTEFSAVNPNDVYPMLIRKLLPHGLLGLMLASFLAAFLSTTDTMLNTGASYFMNDLYKRFFVKKQSDAHYVTISRVVTVFLALLGILVALVSNDVFNLLKLAMKITAGYHICRAVRWFWWRVNGQAEIASLIAAGVFGMGLSLWKLLFDLGKVSVITPTQFIINTFQISEPILPSLLYFSVEISLILFLVTVTWVIVMFLTKPDPEENLIRFYSRVRPAGSGWKSIARVCPNVKITDSLLADFLSWILGMVFVYSSVLCVGMIFFCRWIQAVTLGCIATITVLLLWYKVLDRYDRIAEHDQQTVKEL